MRVVLLQDVSKLGRRGEVKEVSEGYARNFLIPRKLAAMGRSALVAQYERERTQKVKDDEKIRTEAEALVRRLDGITLTLSSKVSPSGTLYAAVGAREIAQELQKKGISVDAGEIEILKAIKVVGAHRAMVNLGHGFKVEIAIKVAVG